MVTGGFLPVEWNFEQMLKGNKAGWRGPGIRSDGGTGLRRIYVYFSTKSFLPLFGLLI
jgi:hypothetical protein